MKLTIVKKNLLSWTAMHIDFVMCKNCKNYSEKPTGQHNISLSTLFNVPILKVPQTFGKKTENSLKK